MEGIVIIAPSRTTISRFSDRVRGDDWRVEVRSEDEIVIEAGQHRVFVIRDDRLVEQYSEDDILRVLGKVSNPIFFAVEFNDFNLGKKVIERIAEDHDLAVDNDHGTIARGTEFVQRMRQEPAWDWRTEGVPPHNRA